MTRDIEALADQMTLAEQVSLLSGADLWSVTAIERLKIGALRVTDGPNGARGGGDWFGGVTAAAFPVGIAIGASWNPELAADIGAAIAQETKSKDAHVLLGPTINMQRSVTNGRNFECFAEDPALTAALAVPYIRAMQAAGIAATPKHFAGNESEIERTTMNSVVDERTLREVYLAPFEAAVKAGGAWAMMSSYNRLNGPYTSESAWLLTDVLGDWGYDGIVMSDWFGSHSTVETVNAGLDLEMPGPTRDRGAALIAAVEAGDVSRTMLRRRVVNMLRLMARTGALDDPDPPVERAEDLPATRALIRRAGADGAVLLKNDGLLPLGARQVAVIGPNAAVAQIMGGGSSQINAHYRISPIQGLIDRLGADNVTFAPGCTNHRWEPLCTGPIDIAYYPDRTLSGDPVHHDTLAQSQTLWMPPIAHGKVDPAAFSARLEWTYQATQTGLHAFGLHAAGYARMFVDGVLVADAHDGWTRGRTFFEEGCDEVVGIHSLTAGQSYRINVEFVSKPNHSLGLAAFRAGIGLPLGDSAIAEAVAVATAAEAVVLCVGRSGEWDTEGSDLTDIALPGNQNALISAVLAANPRTVVVLQTGGPVEMPWLDQARAILQAWYPGQEAGHAIADVLFGDAEPGGRLPQTFPLRWQDNPTWSQDREVYPGLDGIVRYEEGLFIGYRHYDRHGVAPMFPFGFGLGYTTFAISELAVTAQAGGAVAEFTLTNTGARRGAGVAQVYVSEPDAPVTRPVKELKCFAKLTLDPGEARVVTCTLRPRDFAWYDCAAGAWQVSGGTYVIAAGLSAADIHATADVTLEAQQIKR